MIAPKKILLLDHPVSADQKAEARALGVSIIDSKFKDQFTDDQLYKKEAPKKATKKVESKKEVTKEAGE